MTPSRHPGAGTRLRGARVTHARPRGGGPATSRSPPAVGPARRRPTLPRVLGPGLVTGAADDDPSGIATYSAAGATYGLGLLWMPLFTFPLMTAVQLMCARVGLVTGQGLAAVLGTWYPRWVLWTACALLVVANTLNVGADLAGMAEALTLVTGLPARWLVAPLAVLSFAVLAFGSYRQVARTLRWLTLALLAYVGTALLVHPPWRQVLQAMVTPSLPSDRATLAMMVAVLGTTISPYLFFWQAAQEVEQELALGRRTLAARAGASRAELAVTRWDVASGMLLSNVVFLFITLTTATTLHPAGVREIRTAADAALALRPLAGDGAGVLFALGIVGTGLLGVPVLAGSSAYAVAELCGWREGVGERPATAPAFFGVIGVTLLVGIALAGAGAALTGGDAMRLLFWAALVNGVLAVPLLVALLVVCNDRRIMGAHVNGRWLNVFGIVAALVMGIAAGALVLPAH